MTTVFTSHEKDYILRRTSQYRDWWLLEDKYRISIDTKRRVPEMELIKETIVPEYEKKDFAIEPRVKKKNGFSTDVELVWNLKEEIKYEFKTFQQGMLDGYKDPYSRKRN
jgi:hypothetical protein